jgi:hypothetical protein
MDHFWTIAFIVVSCIIALNVAVIARLIFVNNRLTLIEERQANDDIAHIQSISRPDPAKEQVDWRGTVLEPYNTAWINNTYESRRFGSRVR